VWCLLGWPDMCVTSVIKDFLCFDLTSANLDAIVVIVGNKPYRTGERMTRKDYEKIAQVMSEVLNDNAEPSQWMGTVNSLAQSKTTRVSTNTHSAMLADG
jgi:hypothetical protein